MEIVKPNNAKTQEIIPASLPDSPCCGNCPFWNETLKPQNSGEFSEGQCRFNPPVNQVMPIQTLKGQAVGVQAFWPQLPANQWCGKHPERDAAARAGTMLETLEVLREDSPVFQQLLKNAGVIDNGD
jgi:hypothetical protein